MYRFGLDADGRTEFQRLISLFAHYIEQIPLTFLLGFYVGMVIKRWWEQFQVRPASL